MLLLTRVPFIIMTMLMMMIMIRMMVATEEGEGGGPSCRGGATATRVR